jgi:hypothetical protein
MRAKPEQYRTGHGGYVSEFSRFINDFMRSHPDVEAKQIRGWYLLWDHQVDVKDMEEHPKDSVPVKPYQYD